MNNKIKTIEWNYYSKSRLLSEWVHYDADNYKEVKMYHENGKIATKRQFKFGTSHGIYLSKSENGDLYILTTFNHGFVNGVNIDNMIYPHKYQTLFKKTLNSMGF